MSSKDTVHLKLKKKKNVHAKNLYDLFIATQILTCLKLSGGVGGLSMGIKRPGREVDHSPPSSAEIKE
jgi:hypothetical protein